VTERPYQKIPTAKLYEEKRYTEKAIAQFERQAADFERRFSQPGRNNSWVYEEDDYLGPVHSAQHLSKQLAEIEDYSPRHATGRPRGPSKLRVRCYVLDRHR
jgi:hypothetical protein